jgi:hypothetical protein
MVMGRARHVRIDRAAAARLAGAWAAAGVTVPAWTPRHHFNDGTHRTANWLLALDAANFSFWAADPVDRWSVEFGGETLDGYWALAACFNRAVAEGTRLWDARVLAGLSQGDIYRVFRGTGLIPMITDRLNNLREAGRVLVERWQGQMVNLLEATRHDAPAAVAAIVTEFPSFWDAAPYGETEVCFHKRAQLLVSDLWGAAGGRGWGRFAGMDALTAFADYKLPQLLREHGVLAYEADLAARIDARSLLPAGSPEEVEIRAATVQAVDLLAAALAAQGVDILPFQVDWLLWQSAQGRAAAHPYHLTRTMYY